MWPEVDDVGAQTLMKARDKARHFHKNDSYGDRPYLYHLYRTEQVLLEFDYDDPFLLATAWLHDTVEDTAYSPDYLREDFPEQVSEVVLAVTDPPGENRLERKQRAYDQMSGNLNAITVKLADRIANVRCCLRDDNKGLFEIYQDEQPRFQRALYREERSEMWDHLQDLIEGPMDRNGPFIIRDPGGKL